MRRQFVQCAIGEDHAALLAATRDRHAAYCALHGIDYRTDSTEPVNRPPHWRKVELLREAIAFGYQQVAWLDTDCVVVRHEFNLFTASGFGIAVCECWDSPSIQRHFNTGFVIVTSSPETEAFLDTWNAAPPGGRWEDQSAFIALMASQPHRDLLTVLPNRFNCLAGHMEARDPFIRAFHGDPGRAIALPELVKSLPRVSAPQRF